MKRTNSCLWLCILSLVSLNVAAEVKFGPIITTEGVQKTFYEARADYYITEGDILVQPALKKGTKATARRSGRWHNGIVPYLIDESIPDRARVEAAIAYFNGQTSIRMVPRTTESDYVYFKENGTSDCSSFVGRMGGKQNINVPAWCGTGSLIHEILHALGYYHEQSRPDRRKWIKVKWCNIQLKAWFNFFAAPFARKYGSFDFDSIMLYPSYNSFARDPDKPTMTKRDGSTFQAQRRGLSRGDFEALKQMYPAN
ncbi:MAG: M12 family metallopeptidase [Bdellovibrio sp.]|nr:M12 family metallopeptidase [Bdellovibrio sp.]